MTRTRLRASMARGRGGGTVGAWETQSGQSNLKWKSLSKVNAKSLLIRKIPSEIGNCITGMVVRECVGANFV